MGKVHFVFLFVCVDIEKKLKKYMYVYTSRFLSPQNACKHTPLQLARAKHPPPSARPAAPSVTRSAAAAAAAMCVAHRCSVCCRRAKTCPGPSCCSASPRLSLPVPVALRQLQLLLLLFLLLQLLLCRCARNKFIVNMWTLLAHARKTFNPC